MPRLPVLAPARVDCNKPGGLPGLLMDRGIYWMRIGMRRDSLGAHPIAIARHRLVRDKGMSLCAGVAAHAC